MLRREFDAILKRLLEFCGLSSKVFKHHSFRIAAPTSAVFRGSLCDDVVKTLTVAESATIIGFIVYTLQIHCSNVVDTLTAAECWLGLNCGQGRGGM